MALVEWTQSYSVNVKKFDEHHQHLFDLLNSLHDSMKVGKGREVIEEILNALADYADRHFAAEEAEMRRVGYAGLASHAAEHRKFMEKVHGLVKQHHGGQMVVTQEVLNFVCDWLKTHIAKTDRGYVPHMVAARSGECKTRQ